MPAPELLAARNGGSPSMEDATPGGRAEWTSEDLAIALAGQPPLVRMRWSSAWLWRWTGSSRSQLYGCLMVAAINLAEREKWPRRILGKKYLEDLVTHAIAEDRMANVDQQRLLDQHIIYWTESVWLRQVQPKYESIRRYLDEWSGDCHRHAARRLRVHVDNDDD